MRLEIHPRGARPLGWIFVSVLPILPILLVSPPVSAKNRSVDQPLRIGVSWDLEAELGFALAGLDALGDRFFVRARAGILSAEEPIYFTAGATFEASGPVGLAAGFQLGVTHLWSGFWGATGLAIDDDADAFVHVQAGWAIFGFEWHRRLTGSPSPLDDRDVYLVKLRLPIGIFVFSY